MQIRLSYRDVFSATTDTHHEQSEDAKSGNPKKKQDLDILKREVNVHYKLDEERVDIQETIGMPLNALNQMERGK